MGLVAIRASPLEKRLLESSACSKVLLVSTVELEASFMDSRYESRTRQMTSESSPDSVLSFHFLDGVP